MPGEIWVFFLIWLAYLGLLIWATLDAATTPGRVWQSADQEKVVWVLVILLLPLFGPIAYLVSVRRKLRAHKNRTFDQGND
jgi:uncharacterized membrane protein